MSDDKTTDAPKPCPANNGTCVALAAPNSIYCAAHKYTHGIPKAKDPNERTKKP